MVTKVTVFNSFDERIIVSPAVIGSYICTKLKKVHCTTWVWVGMIHQLFDFVCHGALSALNMDTSTDPPKRVSVMHLKVVKLKDAYPKFQYLIHQY
jgi:hypothetical protein